MQVYGACIATTMEEAKALEGFMHEQLNIATPNMTTPNMTTPNMTTPKPEPQPAPIKEVWVTLDFDDKVTGVYAAYDDAYNDLTEFETIEKWALPFLV